MSVLKRMYPMLRAGLVFVLFLLLASPAEAQKRHGASGGAAVQSLRDCPVCPDLATVPAGEFLMGSPESEKGRGKDEGPQHRVVIAKPFAVGKFEVTFAE